MTAPMLSATDPVPTTCLPRGSAVLDRMMFKTALLPNGCWEWRGACNPKGYGNIRVDGYGPAKSVHRVAYIEMVGPIPEGMEIDHLCRNRSCVNPEHLEPVTHTVNVQRRVLVERTHCARRHELDDANTRVTSKGYRVCRTCQREDMRAHRANRRLEQAS